MIISKTPLRISFAGGGTDLRSYYKHNRYGAVLSTSINSYLYVTVKRQTPLFQEKYRLNYSENELVNDLEKIKIQLFGSALDILKLMIGFISVPLQMHLLHQGWDHQARSVWVY